MLQLSIPKYYQVRRGQTVKTIARTFGVAVGVLISANTLTQEVFAGQILRIPDIRGNAYVAQAGDSKALLCGSEENYIRRNGTDVLYPEMTVIL